jgi:hypothetical protein
MLKYGVAMLVVGIAAWGLLRSPTPPEGRSSLQARNDGPAVNERAAGQVAVDFEHVAIDSRPRPEPTLSEPAAMNEDADDPSGESTDNAVPIGSDWASALAESDAIIAKVAQSDRSVKGWHGAVEGLRAVLLAIAEQAHLGITLSAVDCYAAGCVVVVTHASESDADRLQQLADATPTFARWSGATYRSAAIPRASGYESRWIFAPTI